MIKPVIFISSILLSNLWAAQIDPTPFSEKSRGLELLALELSEKRGMNPQDLLAEYHDRKDPTIKAIRNLKKEYTSDMLKVVAILDDAKKLVRVKLNESRDFEKEQYMHRRESFKLFKEEYKDNMYAQEELKRLNDKITDLELKHADFVTENESDLKELENRFFIPRANLVDTKTLYLFKSNVEILKKLEEEYNFLVNEENSYINEYLETIKLAKEKIILKNHNLLKKLTTNKTIDLVD